MVDQSQKQFQGQSQQQFQRVMMSPQMQQALQVMQMPVLELESAIQLELTQNPLLELHFDQEMALGCGEEEHGQEGEEELSLADNDFDILKKLDDDFRDHFDESENYYTTRSKEEENLKLFLEQSLRSEESLFEHLIRLSRETFDTAEELAGAELIVGSLNEQGFFDGDLEELALIHHLPLPLLEKVLKGVQTFEPLGIGAHNLQECLLIQLRSKEKRETLAFQIVEKWFDLLIKNKIRDLAKKAHSNPEEIERVIREEIAPLDCHPGNGFGKLLSQQIVPDVVIEENDEGVRVSVDDYCSSSLKLNRRYLRLLEDPETPEETKSFLRQKLQSAKWLMRNLFQRESTLQQIGEYLGKTQREYLASSEGKLIPMKMKEVADALEIHESTVARAVANKYLYCSKGMIPLRSFFTNGLGASEGEGVSSHTVREVLQRLIERESKESPLSDEKLSIQLKEEGIPCARRTVAKYRGELGLGNANQRRRYT